MRQLEKHNAPEQLCANKIVSPVTGDGALINTTTTRGFVIRGLTMETALNLPCPPLVKQNASVPVTGTNFEITLF